MNKITKYLNQHIVGNVFDKPTILAAYASDRSPVTLAPRFVALPSNTEDIQFLVRFAGELSDRGFQLPVVVRGSGLDATGADLSDGLIISTERLNHVQEIDPRSRLVRVQAGTTLETLNAALSAHGLTVPVQANPKETIGGLIAGFPTDPAAKKYGSIYYYVDRIEAVLASGDLIQTTSFTPRGLARAKSAPAASKLHQSKTQPSATTESTLYRELEQLLDDQFDLVDDLKSQPRHRAGYRMVTEIRDPKHRTFDLLPLFFASQGTLGIITEVILRCEPIPRPATHLLASFRSIRPALDYAKQLSLHQPARLDLYDARIFQSATDQGKNLKIISKRFKKGYYIVASFDDHPLKLKQKLRKILALETTALDVVAETPDNADDFAALDSVFTGYLNNADTERPPLVSPAQIPSEELPAFLTELRELEETYDRELPLYGSLATHTFATRPEFDLTDVDQRRAAIKFIQSFAQLLAEHHGSIAGATAEGRTRALTPNASYKKREKEFYKQLKALFDPKDILNPDVKLGSTASKVVRHLRRTPSLGVMED